MAGVRGNGASFKPAPFSVQCFTGQGYAVVDNLGNVVSGFSRSRAMADLSCNAKNRVAQQTVKAVKRPCLRCGEEFQSAGIHNRMCGRCRHSSSAEAEPVGYSFGATTGRRR